ncbi:VanZ family protein [Agromyces sp. C10]|uniref:VanZ family protein n=1 Tax=Agromyces sp. C10 TaxID=2935077 RepID=UPI00200ACE19|nr:VanZ family protein [Agromyces sp. C10]MCK8609357.1 VanZ family protein [Agromyces sp. C10]
MRPSRAAAVLLFAYAGLVLWATLGSVPRAGLGNQSPNGVLDWRLWLEPSTWTTGLETELMLNVLMFVPLGALLAFALRGVSFMVPVVMAAGFSLAIELAQIPLADRISDPRDLLANTVGALIGVVGARTIDAAVRLATRVLRPRPVEPAAPVARARPAAPVARAAGRTGELRDAGRTGELTASRSGR